MTIFKHIDTQLELAEELANNKYHWATDEGAVSEMFDQYLEEIIDKLKGKAVITFIEDQVQINELFNNWLDCKLSEGDVHSSQVNSYCYVGEYS